MNPGGLFKPEDIRPGMRIGKMEAVSNDYKEFDISSGIRFKGKATLTGEYYDATAEGGMGPRGICLYNLEPESKTGMPIVRYADMEEMAAGKPRMTITAAGAGDFGGTTCFDREAAIAMGFPASTQGNATVVIDDFYLELNGLEGNSDRATLLEVVSVEPKGEVKIVE